MELKHYIELFSSGKHLSEKDAPAFLDELVAATDEATMCELFAAWHSKGYNDDELFGLADVMRRRCTHVKSDHHTFVDAVGTGGSAAKTFNVSTAAAFVIAGAGIPVAKHGNRAATSNSGSADVMSELGIDPVTDAEKAAQCLNRLGICFMFAPNFHRLSPTLAKVRRSLAFPTIFNNLGPLCNPARAPHQLIGVTSPDRLRQTSAVLARLGTRLSWVVCGNGGLDEIALDGPTDVAEVREGSVRSFSICPEDFGFRTEETKHLAASGPAHSADIIRGILAGHLNGTARNLIAINAAAAIYLAGHSDAFPEAAAAAVASIESGSALGKLQDLAAATNV